MMGKLLIVLVGLNLGFTVFAKAKVPELTCEVLSCEGVQPNGGTMAQTICDALPGPFTFTPLNEGGDVLRERGLMDIENDPETTAYPVRYFIDRDGHVNLATDGDSVNDSDIRAYLPIGHGGRVIVGGIRSTVSFADFKVMCAVKE